MEFGGGCDSVLIVMQIAASLGNGGIEIVDGVEVFVDKRLIYEGPKVLGRLEFWAVGGLVNQPDSIRNGKVFRAVPAGVVEDQDNDAVASGAGLLRQGFEQLDKEWLVDSIGDEPDSLSAHRRHEGGDIKPFAAVMAERGWPLADGRPDAPMNRF